MSLYSEIKSFVLKFVKSPIKSAIIAYLLFDILRNNLKESIQIEGIKVFKREKGIHFVQDEESGQYAVIEGNNISYFKDMEEAETEYNKAILRNNSENIQREMGETERTISKLKERYGGIKK